MNIYRAQLRVAAQGGVGERYDVGVGRRNPGETREGIGHALVEHALAGVAARKYDGDIRFGGVEEAEAGQAGGQQFGEQFGFHVFIFD